MMTRGSNTSTRGNERFKSFRSVKSFKSSRFQSFPELHAIRRASLRSVGSALKKHEVRTQDYPPLPPPPPQTLPHPHPIGGRCSRVSVVSNLQKFQDFRHLYTCSIATHQGFQYFEELQQFQEIQGFESFQEVQASQAFSIVSLFHELPLVWLPRFRILTPVRTVFHSFEQIGGRKPEETTVDFSLRFGDLHFGFGNVCGPG